MSNSSPHTEAFAATEPQPDCRAGNPGRRQNGVDELCVERIALFDSVLHAVPDAVIVADRDNNIIEFNPEAERVFGIDRNVALGRQAIDLLVPDRYRDRLTRLFRLYQDPSRKPLFVRTIEVEAQNVQGHEFPVELSLTAVDLPGAPVITAVIKDITERVRAQAALADYNQRTRRGLISVIDMLGRAIGQRDPYTALHQRRVSDLAVAIARKLGLDSDTVTGIEMAALIHDIGKITIPGEILSRPGRLLPEEMNLVKTHARSGFEIVRDVDLHWPVADMILQHHERLDGSGYPMGLKGDQICQAARIIAVADVVEAITSHRPYRASLGIDVALDEIRKNRGKLYDAGVVDACIQLFHDDQFKFKD
ncbi:MAG: HD-GYP domain-containing protein [Sphingomonadales bacterium]